ncbi:MAG: NAD(P)/FAD-dependent oxidoreductase [Candidatus Aminicenantes bacterium]|nr:MAG: NAD(P)/FAD-dependent oxidoreductase [Candidatus Aminicenantes bacterium]
MKEKVAVVGGGISGLSAQYFILSKGFSVELFEKNDYLGGLAGSINFNNFIIEKYYHFICGGDSTLIEFSQKLGIDNKLNFLPTKTAFYYNGKNYPFSGPIDLLKFSPIPLSSRLKFGFHILSSKYKKKWGDMDNIPAKEWLFERIGNKSYQVIWAPLLNIKFGKYHERISAAWIWHRINRVASSRKGPFSKEKMGFFSGGTHTLISELESRIKKSGGLIHVNSEIKRIEKSKEHFNLLLNSGRQIKVDKVILAVPLPIAAKLVENLDSQYAQQLSSIDFLGVRCGIFRLKEKVSDAFWLNINDPRIAANGLIEYSNLNPLKEISPHKIVYIPFYVTLKNEWYSMDQNSFKKKLFAMLRLINPSLTENSIVGFRSFRSPYAQAVCTAGFKSRIPAFRTPVKNLFLLDSTQLYPSDRTLSASIANAEKLVAEKF